jgi:hypothetical protein
MQEMLKMIICVKISGLAVLYWMIGQIPQIMGNLSCTRNLLETVKMGLRLRKFPNSC